MFIEYFTVLEWDGGERHNPKANFLKCGNEEENILKHFGKTCIITSNTIKIYESIADYEESKPEVIRQKALAKLTAEEIKILGIKL